MFLVEAKSVVTVTVDNKRVTLDQKPLLTEAGPEVGEARLLQDVVMTSLDPLLVGGMAVAGMWLGLQLVHPVEIMAAVVSSHQDKTLFHLVEMLAQRETKGEAW